MTNIQEIRKQKIGCRIILFTSCAGTSDGSTYFCLL